MGKKGRKPRIGCIAPGCEVQKHYALGLCNKHWTRLTKYGDLELHYPKPKPPHLCAGTDCAELVRGKFCPRHYYRNRKFGNPDAIVSRSATKARSAEEQVVALFTQQGRRAVRQKHGGNGDVLVDGYLTIEVKSAEAQHKQGIQTWAFNIHRHGSLKEVSDYYIFQFLGVPGFKYALYGAMKSPIGRKTVALSLRTLIMEFAPMSQLFRELLKPKVQEVAAD